MFVCVCICICVCVYCNESDGFCAVEELCVCVEREREREKAHDSRKSENCIPKKARTNNSYKEREKVLM